MVVLAGPMLSVCVFLGQRGGEALRVTWATWLRLGKEEKGQNQDREMVERLSVRDWQS